MLSWNVNSFNPRRTGDKIRLLDIYEWDIAVLQEVVPAMSLELEAQPWVTGLVDGVALAGSSGRGVNGCVVITRGDCRVRRGWVLPTDTATQVPGLADAVPRADRAVAAEIAIGDHQVTAVSFHAGHAAGRDDQQRAWLIARKVRGYVALHDALRQLKGPVVVGMDTNAWSDTTNDPFTAVIDAENPQAAIDEFLLGIGTYGQHGLRDAWVAWLAEHPADLARIRALRPQGPLAVTYRRGSANYPVADRFDRIYTSSHLEVEQVSHHFDEGIGAGSDHGPVIATLQLTP